MAIGQMVALACDANPTKVVGSKRLLPCLQIMLDGYRKVDPATQKKLPVQSDVPELLVETAYASVTLPMGNSRFNNDCFLLPSLGRGIHGEGLSKQYQTNRAVQVRGCLLLQKEHSRPIAMPPARRLPLI